MWAHYEDILSRIPEKPLWWDEHAVPRYVPFSPRETANIYADEACLAEIRCQSCGKRFKVCFSTCQTDRLLRSHVSKQDVPNLRQHVERRTLHYGDPPNIQCCPAGPTMNSEMSRVLEFWEMRDHEWVRVPELEVEFPDD